MAEPESQGATERAKLLLAPPGSERSGARPASRTTKEVLGSIIDFDFNWDFLGFPRILSRLYYEFTTILQERHDFLRLPKTS